MQVRLDDLLPSEADELRSLMASYAALHRRVNALEAQRAAVERGMAELTPELEVVRAREVSLKRSISDRLGEEAELLLPLP